MDEKQRQIELTEAGHEKIEGLLMTARACSLRTTVSIRRRPTWVCCTMCTRASGPTSCFQRDVEYIVQDGQVVLIDEHTGRTMAGSAALRGPASGD